jgi:membrane fusion protein (multidrug efflux system)
MILRISSVFLVILLLVGCGSKKDSKLAPPAIKVGAYEAQKGDLEQALDVSGTLKFQANTTVAAEVSAQIESIDVADGQFVEAGDVLLTFDEAKIRQTASEAAANLQRDEALLTFHKAEWEKNKALHESGSISQTQYDQKLSAYQTALAQVEADKALLAKALEDQAKTKVKAPISGVVSKRYVEKGDWVSPGGKLFQISEFSRIYLEAFITDVDLGKLPLKKIRETGLTCTLTIDSYPGAQYSGTLSYVQPTANDMRLFEIRIYLANPDMNLLQGMVGRARIVYAVTPDVLRIPLRALLDELRNHSPNRVVVVDAEQKARLTTIRVGLQNQEFAEVIEGLKPGDKVVTVGKEVLSEGQPLQVVASKE